MLSIIIVIIGISILILVHELGHFLAAKYFGVPVEEFGFGFPPRIFSKKIGETRYSFNLFPVGGFVRLRGEFALPAEALAKEGGEEKNSFVKQKPWRRAIILIAGVTMNFLIGWILLSSIFLIGAPSAILVNKVLSNSLAAQAGIKDGDKILDFTSASAVTDFIKSHQGQEINLKILRKSNEEVNQKIIIKATPKGSLGIMISDIGMPAQSFLQSIYKGLTTSIFIIFSVLIALANIFGASQNFVGPIGVFGVAVETGRLGLIYLFQLLALISLNLAVLNILPIPALDGGRLFFVILEKLRGRPFSSKVELRANMIGFVFLISLIVIVTVSDILKVV